MVTELNDGCTLEHPLLIDDELTVLKRVYVTLDKQQVGAALDGEEATTGNVDTMGVLEVLDSSTGSGLELDDGFAIVGLLGVDDDLELHALGVHDALERWMSMSFSSRRMQGPNETPYPSS